MSGTRVYCVGTDPWISTTLLIDASDIGRPGLVYIGSHDPDKTMAEFYVDGAWVAWNSQVLPPNMIVRGGLSPVTLNIPMNAPTQKIGWTLLVGYGALSARDEQAVQSATTAIAKIRQQFPERQIPTVDPDYYRQTLTQADMTRNSKYVAVSNWTWDLVKTCDPHYED